MVIMITMVINQSNTTSVKEALLSTTIMTDLEVIDDG